MQRVNVGSEPVATFVTTSPQRTPQTRTDRLRTLATDALHRYPPSQDLNYGADSVLTQKLSELRAFMSSTTLVIPQSLPPKLRQHIGEDLAAFIGGGPKALALREGGPSQMAHVGSLCIQQAQREPLEQGLAQFGSSSLAAEHLQQIKALVARAKAAEGDIIGQAGGAPMHSASPSVAAYAVSGLAGLYRATAALYEARAQLPSQPSATCLRDVAEVGELPPGHVAARHVSAADDSGSPGPAAPVRPRRASNASGRSLSPVQAPVPLLPAALSSAGRTASPDASAAEHSSQEDELSPTGSGGLLRLRHDASRSGLEPQATEARAHTADRIRTSAGNEGISSAKVPLSSLIVEATALFPLVCAERHLKSYNIEPRIKTLKSFINSPNPLVQEGVTFHQKRQFRADLIAFVGGGVDAIAMLQLGGKGLSVVRKMLITCVDAPESQQALLTYDADTFAGQFLRIAHILVSRDVTWPKNHSASTNDYLRLKMLPVMAAYATSGVSGFARAFAVLEDGNDFFGGSVADKQKLLHRFELDLSTRIENFPRSMLTQPRPSSSSEPEIETDDTGPSTSILRPADTTIPQPGPQPDGPHAPAPRGAHKRPRPQPDHTWNLTRPVAEAADSGPDQALVMPLRARTSTAAPAGANFAPQGPIAQRITRELFGITVAGTPKDLVVFHDLLAHRHVDEAKKNHWCELVFDGVPSKGTLASHHDFFKILSEPR